MIYTATELHIYALHLVFYADFNSKCLRWRYTENPTQLIKNFDIPTSVGYRLYRVIQLLLWQTNNYSSIQRFILTTKDSSGVGVTVEATIFHAVQRACTLSNGFVLCKPCLSCQAARHCGSKFRNYNTLFKIQEKWRNMNANRHRTMDRCEIFIK